MERIFISLGTNLGNRNQNLIAALDAIEINIGTLIKKSDVYETAPWGYTDLNWYLNMVVEVQTPLNPFEILDKIEKIEMSMGRIRQHSEYTARTIDLDILFYGNRIINSELLTIPHPHIAKRLFILKPLADVAPDFVHPVLTKSVSVLLNECTDSGTVNKCNT